MAAASSNSPPETASGVGRWRSRVASGWVSVAALNCASSSAGVERRRHPHPADEAGDGRLREYARLSANRIRGPGRGDRDHGPTSLPRH
ncbi:hypothetical protein Aau02nite_82220 [Amorphoplanes auranticolor]|uniref:Uncharacterized protein n=1 Tax=Actinoplanes auranticolor TaxID=47988 RepID=A0A919SVF7_9ACTN|nr:hypothetical protein Aau02nite_82220 [Actinoplanes auranticolor]